MKHSIYNNFYKNKIFLIFFIILIYFKGNVNAADVEIGKSVVPNQCSSLGENNPLRLIDCSIFKLDKGMCCLLTITNNVEKTDEDGVQYFEEVYSTACIILQKIDAQVINSTTIEYKKYGDDVLIECSQLYIKTLKYIFYLIFALVLI